MDTKKYAIIVAGGSGTRMGADIPKQFLQLDGKPILRRSIELFTEAVPGIKIITVLPKEHISWWKDYCVSSNFLCPQIMIEGGITRFHSVKNALSKVPDGCVVGIHDGVRPLVSKELIARLYSSVTPSAPAFIPVLPVTDTLKSVAFRKDDIESLEGPDPSRANLAAAQTPQLFLSDVIKKAYTQAFSTEFTDDASVVKRHGILPACILGEKFNIKITTPEDMILAKAILQLRK